MRESHVQATSEQMSHEHFASTNRANFASVNGGRPAMAAVSHPMTNASMATHTAYNNNAARPAYNANNANHPAYNNNANNAYKAPAILINALSRHRASTINRNTTESRLIRMLRRNHTHEVPLPTTGAGNTNGAS